MNKADNTNQNNSPSAWSVKYATQHELDDAELMKAFNRASVDYKRKYPLVDIVTPQPAAFFAYLRMPAVKQNTTRTKTGNRVSRKKIGSN